MSEDVEVVGGEYALTKIDPVRILVAELDHRFRDIVYDVSSIKGLKAAKEDRALLRGARLKLEEARKAEKADCLARGRYIDKAAKDIAAIIARHEDPLDEKIREEEDRKEKERAAKQQAETDRIVAIQEKLDYFRNIGLTLATMSSDRLEILSADVDRMQITSEIYNEFLPQASKLRNDAATLIREWHARAVAREEAEAKAAAERVELERLRREQEAREMAAKLAEQRRLAEEAETREKARIEEERRLAEARAVLEAEKRVIEEKLAQEREALRQERIKAEEIANREYEARRNALEAEEAERRRVQRAEEAAREALERKAREELAAKQKAAVEQEARLAAERAEIERKQREHEEFVRKASERRQKLQEAKRDDQQIALLDILKLAEDIAGHPNHAQVRAEIAIISEANVKD